MGSPHFHITSGSEELPLFTCPACASESRPVVEFPWWYCPVCQVRLIPADLGPHDYRRSVPPLFTHEPLPAETH